MFYYIQDCNPCSSSQPPKGDFVEITKEQHDYYVENFHAITIKQEGNTIKVEPDLEYFRSAALHDISKSVKLLTPDMNKLTYINLCLDYGINPHVACDYPDLVQLVGDVLELYTDALEFECMVKRYLAAAPTVEDIERIASEAHTRFSFLLQQKIPFEASGVY